jgi:hypothetical protein
VQRVFVDAESYKGLEAVFQGRLCNATPNVSADGNVYGFKRLEADKPIDLTHFNIRLETLRE